MLKAGLTGGMACGKSFVAAELARLGCRIVEADDIGRSVMEPGGEAYTDVVEEFGLDILNDDDEIDRVKLAGLVFGNPVRLKRLNAIVHPAVRERALREFAEITASDPKAVIVYVAAILIESGAWRDMDKILVVTCERAQQIERAMRRPGNTEAAVLARLASQMPLDEKRTHADFLIDTSGTKEDTLSRTRAIYEELKRLAQ